MKHASLGKRINIARKDAGLTADKLSEMCNINAVYLRQIEGDTKTPSLPVFISLCNALQVSPNYLLQDEVNTTRSFEIEEFEKLFSNATPSQQHLALSMLRAALQEIS